MSNRLDTTGKSKAMRRMERQTLVIQFVDPATLAANRPKPRPTTLTPAQQEQAYISGTLHTGIDR